MTREEAVVHPPHYCRLDPQPIDVLARWNSQGVHYNNCQAIRYLSRAGAKFDEEEDLLKAISYIEHRLQQIRGERLEDAAQ